MQRKIKISQDVYQNNWNITLRPCHRTCTQIWKSAKRFLELGENGEQPAPVLRTNTLDLIDEKYNNAEWTHVYIDGSATEAVKDAGSGIFIKFPSGNVKRISIPAGHTCSNYKAELLAIQTALDSLEDLELNKRNIALFTDSLSALQGLDSDRDDLTLLKIKQSLSKLGEEKNIVLQWMPAHCGIPGNEEADKLAKRGRETNDDQPSSLTFAEVKTIVKTKWDNDWKKNHSDYSMEKEAMHNMEREQQKTIFAYGLDIAASGHCINRAKWILLTAIVDQWHRHHIMFCRTALSLMDFEKRSGLHLPQ